MAILGHARPFIVAALFSLAAANASPFQPPEGMRFCPSGEEFQKALTFIRADADLIMPEERGAKVALEVAKGCTDSAKRFEKSFQFLKKSGIDVQKSLELALSFAPLSNEAVEAFMEIYRHVLLENYLNLDFTTSFRLALELSRDYKGDPKKLREDFVQLVKFCLSEKEMALDYKSCADLTLQLTKFTELFPQGVFPEFKNLYGYLRFDKKTGLSIAEADRISRQVLAKGSESPKSFISTLNFLLTQKPPPKDTATALKLALDVASLSLQKVPEKATK